MTGEPADRARRRVPWRLLRSEAIAGVPGAIGGVPDGMAASVLAGVNPIHGLYASAVGPIVGGTLSSTKRMVITTTSAAALAGGSAVAGLPAGDRPVALFLVTVLAGVVMVVAGLARLGRYVRFVSHSVMLGFLTGVAINILFGQLPDLTGVDASGRTAVQRGIDVLFHPGQVDLPTLVVGLVAIAIVLGLRRTRVGAYAALAAIVVPTALVLLANLDVAQVDDDGAIPTGVPTPAAPGLAETSVDVILGALSVAVIVLIQGAGVAEGAPNLDGSRGSVNRDFIAQGAANVAAGVLQGQPVGGSVGRTALNLTVGARDRWAGVFSGVWMVVILVFFSGAVGQVPMTTLAALLIVAAGSALQLQELRTVWRSGATSQIALGTTLVATLALPIAPAVGIGIALSLLLQLNQEAMDLRVVELQVRDADFVESPAPARLPSREVTLLDAYGSLLYAGSRTLARRLPDPAGSDHAAVVLRLRGRVSLGSTFFVVVREYAEAVGRGGGRLYLSGVSPELHRRMRDARVLDAVPNLEVFPATEVLGASSLEAYEAARRWVDGLGEAPAG